MNQVMTVLMNRKSIRAYENRPVEPEVKAQILQATLRAPTAGNMMLYSIIDVTDQGIKDKLAVTCDNQPFIATAPLVRATGDPLTKIEGASQSRGSRASASES